MTYDRFLQLGENVFGVLSKLALVLTFLFCLLFLWAIVFALSGGHLAPREDLPPGLDRNQQMVVIVILLIAATLFLWYWSRIYKHGGALLAVFRETPSLDNDVPGRILQQLKTSFVVVFIIDLLGRITLFFYQPMGTGFGSRDWLFFLDEGLAFLIPNFSGTACLLAALVCALWIRIIERNRNLEQELAEIV